MTHTIKWLFRAGLLFSSLLLASCASHRVILSDATLAPSTVSLNGVWQFMAYDGNTNKQDWQSISVPANWYKQGFDVSGIAHYQKQFVVNEGLKGKRIELVFNGVDYITDVWLNGQKLGTHEGYFQTFSFDATPLLKWGERNTLLVQVDSPLEKKADFSLHKRLIKGIFSHHDTRPGGAWSERGQEKNTGGIWNSVALHISEQVFASQLKAIPKKVDSQNWQLDTEIELQGELPEDATFHWQLKAKNHSAEIVSGNSQHPVFTIQAHQPKLWWPIGFGEPNLYELTVQVKQQGSVLEEISAIAAFRQVELSENREWVINGQRILLRGTNYIASQWLSEMNKPLYERDVDLMMAANINAVRVHAHITSPEFYEVCDEKGMMVWQDFPLQWGYQDSDEFHQQARLQLGDMLNQLANHPSIIHWTLHNEPPWDADWMKWKYPDYSPEQNKALDEMLYAEAIRLDASRPVSKYSATKEHPWLGWYSGHWLDYAKPTDQAFIAEFGAQALPDKAILKRILKGDISLPDVSDAERKQDWKSWAKWKYHNFQPRETFDVAKVNPGKNTDELIHNTQVYQARLNQLAAESYRRQAYKPVTALFQFMFVEDWASMNWGIVDYWRNTKPGYDSLKKAYQPILPSLEWSQVDYPQGSITVGLWVLNDTLVDYQDVRYEIELKQNDIVLDLQDYKVSFDADAHEKIGHYLSPELALGQYTMVAKLIGQDGRVIAYNDYHFNVKESEINKHGNEK